MKPSTHPVRIALVVALAVSAVILKAGEPASSKAMNPCRAVRNIELPSDDFGLAIVQGRILACARHLQLYRFGKENRQQCVPFANALMDILRPGLKDRVVGQSRPFTAGRFTEALRSRKLLFPRDEMTGLPRNPGDTKSRPVFVWWDTTEKSDGHVGVYIGGGLFIDAYVGFELAKLSAKEVNAITDPSRWAWSVVPRPQTGVPWPEGFWPRQKVNDGFSVVRVRGA